MIIDRYKAVIIEDDKNHALYLQDKLDRFVPSVEVIDVFHSIEEAMVGIPGRSVKILFLDWQLNGDRSENASHLLDALSTDSDKFWIVYVSGERVGAFEAIRSDFFTLAFITKPLTNSSFQKLNAKLLDYSPYALIDNLSERPRNAMTLTLKSGHRKIRLSTDDFLYCIVNRRKKNVVTVVTRYEDIDVRMSLNEFNRAVSKFLGQNECLHDYIYQPNQSCLVNPHCIHSYDKRRIYVRFKGVTDTDRKTLARFEFEIGVAYSAPY